MVWCEVKGHRQKISARANSAGLVQFLLLGLSEKILGSRIGTMSANFALYVKEVDVVHLLAFVGGFVDTAGYLRLLGVFTSSITGNLVVATASVASMRGVICRSLVCVAFFLAGAVGAALSLRLRLAHSVSQRVVCCFLFTLEIAFIIASWVIGMQYDTEMLLNDNIDWWLNVLVGCLLGASMGFHNVAAKEAITNCPPTTVMTSTMITVAQNLTNTIEYALASYSCLRLQPTPGHLTEVQKEAMTAKYVDSLGKFKTTAKPLFAFIVGCIIGAITMDHGSWHCLAIPVAVLALIIADAMMQQAALGAAAETTRQLQALELERQEKQKQQQQKEAEAEAEAGAGNGYQSVPPSENYGAVAVTGGGDRDEKDRV